MKKIIRLISLLLAAVTLLSVFCICAGAEEKDDTPENGITVKSAKIHTVNSNEWRPQLEFSLSGSRFGGFSRYGFSDITDRKNPVLLADGSFGQSFILMFLPEGSITEGHFYRLELTGDPSEYEGGEAPEPFTAEFSFGDLIYSFTPRLSVYANVGMLSAGEPVAELSGRHPAGGLYVLAPIDRDVTDLALYSASPLVAAADGFDLTINFYYLTADIYLIDKSEKDTDFAAGYRQLGCRKIIGRIGYSFADRVAGSFAVLLETAVMTAFAPAYGTFATLFFSFLSAFTVFGVLFLTLENQ